MCICAECFGIVLLQFVKLIDDPTLLRRESEVDVPKFLPRAMEALGSRDLANEEAVRNERYW